MSLHVRPVEYFYVRLENDPAKAWEFLAKLAGEEINLLAFSAVPYGARHTELTLFPDSPAGFLRAAKKLGWNITGPQHAILIQGDDALGAAADIHKYLNDAGVGIYASTGITDGAGRYGYVIYVREADYKQAERALREARQTVPSAVL